MRAGLDQPAARVCLSTRLGTIAKCLGGPRSGALPRGETGTWVLPKFFLLCSKLCTSLLFTKTTLRYLLIRSWPQPQHPAALWL
ncbi:MAG: hypothetical protein KTR25_16835 [Myxococcales bacterium]|nr:hypothetical protein [Myxococcales bacterium]